MSSKDPMFVTTAIFGGAFTIMGSLMLAIFLMVLPSEVGFTIRFLVIGILSLFIIIGLVFLVYFFRLLHFIILAKKIKKYGKVGVGHYLSSLQDSSVNNQFLYKITYSWITPKGEERIEYPPDRLVRRQIDYLERNIDFEIFYLDEQVTMGNIYKKKDLDEKVENCPTCSQVIKK